MEFSEAYQHFVQACQPDQADVNRPPLRLFLDELVRAHREVFIHDLEPDFTDADTLLLEYGFCDRHGNGDQFIIALTRHVYLKHFDKSGEYGVGVVFKPDPFRDLEPLTLWCGSQDLRDRWRQDIIYTPGWVRAANHPAHKIEFILEKPH
ncbi:MAG: hypothetical protein AAGB22_10225 [Bacteroidota bacterium]